MPSGSRYGRGLRSVNVPITGWNSDAVSWKVSVMMPICAKVRLKRPCSNG